WVDDDFPAGAKANVNEGTAPLTWVTEKDGQVFSGKRAIKRTASGLAQDFFNGIEKPFAVPANGHFYVHAFVDPANPPKAIMVQLHTGTWSHRVVWGDADAIEYGKKDSPERLPMGPLPKAGEWARLEFSASKLALKAGTKIDGVAFTQNGGTVYWDKLGVISETDPSKDPLESFAAWLKENARPPKELPKEIQDLLKVKAAERKPEQEKKLREYYIENVCSATRPAFEALNKELDPVKKAREEFDKTIPATFIWKDMEKPRDSFIMVRGQYTKPGERVYPNTPAFLPPLAKTGETNRLAFAKWLVSAEHPLTARVTVNRFWQQFFGTGLVKTANDFGAQGQPPSHPELLDWLAVTFREEGWDMKRFVKLIVTSATYRQDSKSTPKMLAADPENRFYARGPRFRLDAEVIRDSALYVSGLLVPTIGGKGVRPYQPENIWEPVAYSGSNTKDYKQDHGDALYRRSLYTFWKRTAPPPSMTTFDAPSREQFCVRRERSNTPLQALNLLNDVQYVEAARVFAQRMMKEGGATAGERLAWAFRFTTSRKPTKAEQSVLDETFFRELAKYRAAADAAKQVIAQGESKPDDKLDPSELAAYTLAANMILNLDETLTKN
ncbi:MAG: DUF1553 domain-containing protein, partial [Verrucomicrobia bacterium]|nr:DUF1553 domain-containing protein [Verrucomicrobiota bacterium]